MSGSAACLKCPVCNTGGVFESSETLRDRLLFVSTHIVICPVCQEEVLGLSKLIGHLITHVHLLKVSNRNDDYTTSDIKSTTEEYARTELQNDTKLTSKKCKSKNKIDTKEPLKYIKIFPKLPVVSMAAPGNSSVSMKIRANETKCTTDTICTLCGLQFVDSNVLKMHMCLIHNVEEDSNQNITKYQCHLCPKYFKMRGSLMVHLRVAHFGFCNQNSQQGDENGSGVSDKQINAKGDNKQWQCDVCRKYFTTKYFLKKHKRLHTGETPYSCTQCNKTFTFQQSYHKHLLYHNDEKPHCCNVCGRAFKELSTLHNHQRIHTGEKPFSCETCGKCFRQRVSYLVHRRIHTGVMPYKCTACEKSFRYKVSQRTHKCSAQPPGTVIRQSGDLVEKLKRKQTTHIPQSQKPTAVIEVSEENAELVRNGAKLSLEDTQSENFSIISTELADNSSGKKVNNSDALNNLSNEEYDTTNFDELINSIPTEDTNVPSPSEILKNLCLSHDNLNLMMM